MSKSKIRQSTDPKPASKLRVSEVSDDELRARTRVDQEEWRKLLQLGMSKNLRIECPEYKEARVLAQRLTAIRSFYGFEVRVQHRGKEIFISPRKAAVEVEFLPAGDDAIETDGCE